MRWLALAIVVPFLAGCFGGPGSLIVETPLPPEPFVLVRTVVDPTGGQGEPSLGVTPDGVLWTNGQPLCVDIPDPLGCMPSGSQVYRSGDGGLTWTKFPPPTGPLIDGDPDLAVDADGTVWYSLLWSACNAVGVSRDDGETWSMNPAVCNGPVGDRQYVIPTEGGTAYLYWHQLPSLYQTAMTTTDYGATWLPTGPVESPDHHLLVNGGSNWGGGGFWNRATNSVFMTYTWYTWGALTVPGVGGPREGLPGFAVTRDGGQTWETDVAAQEPWGEVIGLGLVVGAADDEGNIYLAWGEEKGTDDQAESAVFLVGSRDDGRTWTEPVKVNVGNESIVLPAIAAGAPGHVAVAYYEANETGVAAEMDPAAEWNVALSWTNDLFGAAAFNHSHLNEVAVRNGSICALGTGCGADREFLDYFALERLPDGRVGAVYNAIVDVEEDGETVPRTLSVFAATRDPILGAVTP